LPPAFEGFRLLHLSDLHLDLDAALANALYAKVGEVSYHACIITGDFRAETHGPSGPCLEAVARLMTFLHPPVYGILGNHDYLEMTPPLEALGIHMLLNENTAIEREGERIYLMGVDDPHFYEAENFDKALAGIPDGKVRLLLAHSAEIYRQALAAGVDYLFCGHTHGGQLCFPWGQPVSNNARQPRVMLRGAWNWYGLRGYTSLGSGCSMLPVRLFAPPEITLHTLRRGDIVQ
jgi:predicted MPP superfamily phosphohydrolase